MKPIINWNDVKPSDGSTQRPQAGGYVCVITKAEDVPEKQYLLVEFDIAEGDFAGYCSETAGRFGNWPALGKTYRSYKENAAGMFKAFVNAVEGSAENKNFKWNWKEDKLVGKFFGGILGEEEYLGQDGTIKTSLKLTKCVTTDVIRSGDFKVPAIKKLKESDKPAPAASGSFTDVTVDDIPF